MKVGAAGAFSVKCITSGDVDPNIAKEEEGGDGEGGEGSAAYKEGAGAGSAM